MQMIEASRLAARLLSIAGIATLLFTHSAFAQASFSGIGFRPGYTLSHARDVSSDGSTVVGTSGSRAVLWTAGGGMQVISDISYGESISGNGLVPVGSDSLNSPQGHEAVRWTQGGGRVGLGYLTGASSSYGEAASSDGSVVTGYNTIGTVSKGFYWTAGSGMKSLNNLPGGSSAYSRAVGVSGDGTRITGYSRGADGIEAAIWNENQFGYGTPIGLGFLAGGIDSRATDISLDGSAVVGHDSVPGGPGFEAQAFRWMELAPGTGIGSMIPLGNFGKDSKAHGVSGDGSIVIGSSKDIWDWWHPFIWDEVNGMRKIADVLTSLGIDLTGWDLDQATGISADGNTIVGTGLNPSGQVEGWVATIPEPGTGLLVGLGMMMLAGRRRGA